jgi:hypothetical protein
MGPANSGGLGASGGAVLVAVIIAIVVLIMIDIGGGLTRPLIAPRHAATAQGATTQATTTQAQKLG